MDAVPAAFRPHSEADIVALIEANPLAWLVVRDAGALLIPLRPILADGALVALSGHLPRRSGLHQALRTRPDALALFTGRQAYLSPSWLAERGWAPTWASESAAFACRVTLLDNPRALRRSLTDLVAAMEAGRPNPWSIDEIARRYDALASRIVAFRAQIVDRRAAFRLGQDERDEVFADLLEGLRGVGQGEIADAMVKARAR